MSSINISDSNFFYPLFLIGTEFEYALSSSDYDLPQQQNKYLYFFRYTCEECTNTVLLAYPDDNYYDVNYVSDNSSGIVPSLLNNLPTTGPVLHFFLIPFESKIGSDYSVYADLITLSYSIAISLINN